VPRVVVALLTPLGRPEALREHVDFLVEAGVDALMPCGTTGEGPLLEDGEIAEWIRSTVEAAAGRLPVLAHVGRPSTEATVALARRALASGASGVSAVVPYFYALGDEQLTWHYTALIAAADGAPSYAYTIPARTGNELPLDVVRELAAEGLTGVKDSTKSWERHLEYLETEVDVFIGTDALVVDSFRAGSAGCVSALANVRPDLLCRARDGEDVQEEISALRTELTFPKLKSALAEQLPGYPTAYRSPLG
jgi:4-hydroxy-tetrahydrodipicolinate synthase